MTLKNPDAIAAVVTALRLTHGDETARAMLVGGMSLAALTEAMFSAPVERRDAVRYVRVPWTTSPSRRNSARSGTFATFMKIMARFGSSIWRLRPQQARCPVKTCGYVCQSSYLATSAIDQCCRRSASARYLL